MAPFTLRITGNATTSKKADQANVRILCSSAGHNKQAMSDQVSTTAKYIEDMIQSAQAQELSPISHWSQTKLSIDSWIEHVPSYQAEGRDTVEPNVVPSASSGSLFGNNPLNLDSRKYNIVAVHRYRAHINFDVHFRNLTILSQFSSHLASLDHCTVENVNWVQTPAADEECKSQLRMKAAKDARSKVVDYCRIVCPDQDITIVPVELSSEKVTGGASSTPVFRADTSLGHPDSAVPRKDGSSSLTPQAVNMALSIDFVFTVETDGFKQSILLHKTGPSLESDA